MSQTANRDFAVDVVRQLQAAGYEAVWAGGCVRDRLLGLKPKDFDVATSAVPDQVRAVFGESRTWAVGEAFGVIVVRGPRGVDQIEVATFRIDGGYSDGRRPDSVEFSSAEEDAKRRDFTINGMFFDPLTEKVIDYVGGQVDLEQGIVRAIGNADARFDDDKLRMLRAMRFAAKFGFDLEPSTLAAIQKRPADIHVVSGERIGVEMTRMLSDKNCRIALELLDSSRLLTEVLPESDLVMQTPERRLELLASVEAVTREEQAPRLPVVLALLLRDWTMRSGSDSADEPIDAREMAQEIAQRWKLSNQDKDLTRWLLENQSLVRRAQDLPWPRVQRVLVHNDVQDLLGLSEAIARGTNSMAEQQHVAFCRRKMAADPAEWNPPPLLNGDDLHKQGISPGPIFKKLLTSIRDAQLDGKIASPEQAWKLVENLMNEQE